MSPATGVARLAGWILSSVHMENFSRVTRMKSGDAIIQAWNLTTKPGEKCCRIFRFYWFYKPQNSHIFTSSTKRNYPEIGNLSIVRSIMEMYNLCLNFFSSRWPEWRVHMGKFSSLSYLETKISLTKLAHLLIWTHQIFYKGNRSQLISGWPGYPGIIWRGPRFKIQSLLATIIRFIFRIVNIIIEYLITE